LQRTKRWLGGITIGVLLLEFLFIFRPITRFVSAKIQSLREERIAQEVARLAAEKAVEQREKSLRELQALNEAIDEAVLFATLRRDGSPVYLSQQLSKIIGWREADQHRSLLHRLHPGAEERASFLAALTEARANNWRGEWKIQDTQGKARWLNVTIVPARRTNDEAELFLLASDVTEHKASQAALEQLSQERMEEQVQLSKQRAQQVVNAQEKERLRIARDLHDGIGQKLTALKMGLESLEPNALPQQEAKVVALRDLAKEVILSVRVATFNLSPPELSDYGLAVGLDKLCRELSRLTGQHIVLEKNGFAERFDPVREISVFRIVQEAINNAIKYAGADYILVSISPGERLFSITVSDNGTGFDPENATTQTGLGLNNMISRVEDMDGRLFVHSDPDTGTKITINLPMRGE
ncbi:MAG: ATP-binding protein, partial [Bacteroidota bacterium]